MVSCRDVYVAVWNKAAFRGAHVHYDRLLPDGPSGLFDPDEDTERPPVPKIHIAGRGGSRSGAPFRCGITPRLEGLTESEVAVELYILAHEVGHFLSWLSGRDGDNEARSVDAEMRAALVRYNEIVHGVEEAAPNTEFSSLVNAKLQQELTDAERRLIFNEEMHAWKLGRELLVEFGLADLQAYDAREEASLDTYRERLGVD